jgi:hypothetical protein
MRTLGILVCTVVGGSLLAGILNALALFGLDALDSPDGIRMLINGLVLPVALLLAGWGSVRLLKTRDEVRPMDERQLRSRFPLLFAMGIGTLAIVIAGIDYLEATAEASARAFCDQSKVGTPMAEVARAAKGKGTDFYRSIQPDEVRVAFTGLPPFSRYFCKVEGKNGLVVRLDYYYLD